jgi:hypothetical protein
MSRIRYSPALKEEVCRMLSAGMNAEEISERCSVPKSMVHRVSREMGVEQNKAIVLHTRSLSELMALPKDKQGEYFDEVARKAALKAVSLLDTLPGEALIQNSKSVISIMRWAKDVLAPVQDATPKRALLNLDRVLEGAVEDQEATC